MARCHKPFSELFSSVFKVTNSSKTLPCRHAHISRTDWRTSCQEVRFNDRSHVQRQKPFRECRSCFLIWICLAQPTHTLLRSVIKYPRPQKGPLPGGHGSPVSSPGVFFALQGAQEPLKCPVLWPSWACLPTLHLYWRHLYQ